MKLIYYITIPILVLLIIWFSFLLLFIKPVEIDKKLIETNSKLLKNDIQGGGFYSGGSSFRESISQVIWQKNLFDPTRGVSSKTVAESPTELSVELLGIYSFQGARGAVIVPKQGGMQGMSGGSYGGYKPPGQGGAQAEKKIFFKIGESLDNGYTVTAVGRDYVELTGGGNIVKVPLKYGSDESSKRIASSAKKDVKRQITVINSGGGQSGGQSQSQSGGGPAVIQSSQQGGGANYGAGK